MYWTQNVRFTPMESRSSFFRLPIPNRDFQLHFQFRGQWRGSFEIWSGEIWHYSSLYIQYTSIVVMLVCVCRSVSRTISVALQNVLLSVYVWLYVRVCVCIIRIHFIPHGHVVIYGLITRSILVDFIIISNNKGTDCRNTDNCMIVMIIHHYDRLIIMLWRRLIVMVTVQLF